MQAEIAIEIEANGKLKTVQENEIGKAPNCLSQSVAASLIPKIIKNMRRAKIISKTKISTTIFCFGGNLRVKRSMPTNCPARKAQSAPKKEVQARRNKAASIFQETETLNALKSADKSIAAIKSINRDPHKISSALQKTAYIFFINSPNPKEQKALRFSALLKVNLYPQFLKELSFYAF
jgi:hypothetical protein